MTDFETWLLDFGDRIYRYWVYKRMFTPYEIENKFKDESVYEDDVCEFGRIKEAIELPDGDILLGFEDPEIPQDASYYNLKYHRLSEISLACYPSDMEQFLEDEEDEE